MILYAYAIDDITETVIFASIASILSIFATCLTYLIDHDSSDIVHDSYMLFLRKRNASRSTSETLTLDDVGSSTKARNDLSVEEKMSIKKNAGRTLALSRELAGLFQSQPKCIEVGKTITVKQGALLHVVHALDQSKLLLHQKELRENGDDTDVNVTPRLFVKQLYASAMDQVAQTLCDHFGLEGSFVVEFDENQSAMPKITPTAGAALSPKDLLNRIMNRKSVEGRQGGTYTAVPVGEDELELVDTSHIKKNLKRRLSTQL